MAAWTAAKSTGKPPCQWAGSPLASCLRAAFRKWDWDTVAPWTFVHLNITGRAVTVSLDPRSPDFVARKAMFAKYLRESWRAAQYNLWLATDRVDATAAKGIAYDSQCCSAARTAVRRDRHAWMVAIGALVSPSRAWKSVENHDVPQSVAEAAVFKCPWCSLHPAGFSHIVWECPESHKPSGLQPRDNLQARLGWPMCTRDSPQHDMAVMTWMSTVRRTLIERWPVNDDDGGTPWQI